MQEPFCSVPLVWAIQEDTLANRLPAYEDMSWEHLISFWRSAFSRADVIVFPDFSLPVNCHSIIRVLLTANEQSFWHFVRHVLSLCLSCYSFLYQMLYSVLDTGNFFVIPGSPIDVWAAEGYSKSHSKMQLRTDNGFNKDDMLVLIVGSSFFYNELSWEYAVAMHDIGPVLLKYARGKDSRGAFKFLFLGGNSTNGYTDALQVENFRLVYCWFPCLLSLQSGFMARSRFLNSLACFVQFSPDPSTKTCHPASSVTRTLLFFCHVS